MLNEPCFIVILQKSSSNINFFVTKKKNIKGFAFNLTLTT